MISTHNNLIACSPFPKQNMEKVIKSGIAMIDKKIQLQELSVVLPGEVSVNGITRTFKVGTKVWVRGDQVTLTWAKETFQIEGHEFILVPATAIQLVGE